MKAILSMFLSAAALAALIAFEGPIAAQDFDLEKPVAGIEIQTRGPVHEAFAQPIELKPEQGLPTPKEPPPAIPEDPAVQRPEGDNVQWIPGYWSWDAERNEFVWVSGVFRNAPPGRQFVPGHWVHTADGWVWVPGFWAPLNQGEMPYVPEPPAPLETDPSIPPPDANSFYVPGNWVYRDSRYAWHPGYYAPFRDGRVWVAPRYLWTPAGFIFVPGYWDYPLDDRGLLFAPVVFAQPFWQTPGWVYRPSYVVAPNFLLDSLFIRTRSFQFYFGNFYGPAYARAGFNPWFAGTGRRDPLFSYYRWNNRSNASWLTGLEQLHADRVAGRVAVPPMTFAQQTKIVNQAIVQNNIRVVTPIGQFKSDKIRLVQTSPSQMASAQLNSQRSMELSKMRALAESGKAKTPRGEHTTLKLPTSGPANVVVSPALPKVHSSQPSTGKAAGDAPRTITLPPMGTNPGVTPLPKVTTTPLNPAPAPKVSSPPPKVIDVPKSAPPLPNNTKPKTGSVDAQKAVTPMATPRSRSGQKLSLSNPGRSRMATVTYNAATPSQLGKQASTAPRLAAPASPPRVTSSSSSNRSGGAHNGDGGRSRSGNRGGGGGKSGSKR